MNIARFMLVALLGGGAASIRVPIAARPPAAAVLPMAAGQPATPSEPAARPRPDQSEPAPAAGEKKDAGVAASKRDPDRWLSSDLRDAPKVKWKHQLDYLPAQLRSATFAADSRTICVHIHEQTIDVWQLLFVPRRIIGGVLLGIITLGLALGARRIVRRRQRLGHLYCAKCNYDVAAQTGADSVDPSGPAAKPDAKCPECGVDLNGRPPRAGRRTLARLAPLLAAFVLVAGFYAYMCTPAFARHHWSRVQGWTSAGLARFAERHGVRYLTKQARDTDRVIEVDLETGRTIRTVLRRNTRSYGAMSLSPDGKTLLMSGPASESVAAYRVSSGSRLRAATMPGSIAHDNDLPAAVGWSQDSGTAYIAWFDRDQNVNGVSAWNWRSGSMKELFRTPGYKDPNNGFSHGRLFARLGSADPPRFVSWPNFMEAFPTKTFRVRVHGENQPEREFSPSPTPAALSEPALTPDGSMMFFPVDYREMVMCIDPMTSQTIGTLATTYGAKETIDIDGAGRRMVIDGTPLVVRDIIDRRWVACLVATGELYGPRPSISRDGRWVAAVMQKNIASPQQYGHDLVLWKIDSSPADAADPTASKPSRPDAEP